MPSVKHGPGNKQNNPHKGAPRRWQKFSLSKLRGSTEEGNVELSWVVGRRKVSGIVSQNRYAWTDPWEMGRCLTSGYQHPRYREGTKTRSTAIWLPHAFLPIRQRVYTVHGACIGDLEMTGWPEVKLESCGSRQRKTIYMVHQGTWTWSCGKASH